MEDFLSSLTDTPAGAVRNFINQKLRKAGFDDDERRH